MKRVRERFEVTMRKEVVEGLKGLAKREGLSCSRYLERLIGEEGAGRMIRKRKVCNLTLSEEAIEKLKRLAEERGMARSRFVEWLVMGVSDGGE